MRRKSKRPTITLTGQAPTLNPSQQVQAMMAARAVEPSTDAHGTTEPTPCRVCGASVDAEGAAYLGVWRQHPGCVPAGVFAPHRVVEAARWLQLDDLTLMEATLIPYRLPLFAEVETEPTSRPQRLPWRHVDRKALSRALAELPDLRVDAGLDPSTCTLGRCAWCGVEESLAWTLHGHRWADGTEAPLCKDCGESYEQRGRPLPSFWQEQREAISQALTGVALPMGYSAPQTLLAYAERPDGDGSAWSHLRVEAVDSYRWWVWTKWPSHAPEEVRQEARQRAAQQEARKAAQRAQEAAVAAERADVHGFGVG